MQLQHEFTLAIPPDRAWATLLDVRRVAPCMPGATLDHVDGDTFAGRVTLKIGPLRLDYRGDAAIVEKDAAARRLVIEAAGREARGSGTAKATVTAVLEPADDGTRVLLSSELALTGRPAQFGGGLVAEVSEGIIGQFARRLSHEMHGDGGPSRSEAPQALPDAPGLPGTAHGTADGSTDGDGPATAQPALDVFALLGPVVKKRALPAAVGLAVLVGAFLLGRRGARARSTTTADPFTGRG